ncbi:protein STRICTOSIDINE SYNTHASE-LIKE 10-like [Bidens hawaiensis]|uniref:protein STRICTOSIDINE SYNTHASE-LIKE 10-like n=1 Tax=Bidens hawaiensis TaxID=980011 RepID=UPI0040496B55
MLTSNNKLFFSSTTIALILITYVLLLLTVRFPSNKNHSGDGDYNVEHIPINGGAVGPESFDFNPVDGSGPFTGVSDGRIVKLIESEGRWSDFAVTSSYRESCGGPEMEDKCGRPLDLKFDKNRGVLYIADASFGLLELGPNGGLATSLVSEVQGLPLLFTNALDIDYTNGFIYFTDSSQLYTRRDHLLVVLTGDKTGRLLKYNLETKEVAVVLHNLMFPNGVALSKDGNFLLVVETASCRVLRLWLKTPKAGTLEVFTDLPGYPDNIKITENGEFWVGMYSRKAEALRWIHSIPCIANILGKLPFFIVRLSSYIVGKLGGEGLAAKLGVDGDILTILEDVNGKTWKYASEVMERDGYLWIGSVENPFAVKMKIQ